MKSKEQIMIINNSQLLSEWDYQKNAALNLYPETTPAFSNQKVWWKNSEGLSWDATVASRSKGAGCPYYTGNRVLAGYNDAFSQAPQFMDEWDYTLNTVNPMEIPKSSGIPIHWICRKNSRHKWCAPLNRRQREPNCPFCTNRLTLEGYNDLQHTYPEISEDWDYNKNWNPSHTKKFLPTEIFYGTTKIVDWKCHICGHEYRKSVRK